MNSYTQNLTHSLVLRTKILDKCCPKLIFKKNFGYLKKKKLGFLKMITFSKLYYLIKYSVKEFCIINAA